MALSHIDVARAWVRFNEEGQGRSERQGFNVYYRDDTIYSYGHHFPIASFATGPTGECVVLFTNRGYSISTAKHKNIVHRALGYRDVIYVRDPSSRAWGELARECSDLAKALRDAATRRRSDWRREDDLRYAEANERAAKLFARWARKAGRLAA